MPSKCYSNAIKLRSAAIEAGGDGDDDVGDGREKRVIAHDRHRYYALAAREPDTRIDLDFWGWGRKLEHRHLGHRVDFGVQMDRLEHGAARERASHRQPHRNGLPVVGERRKLDTQALPT